MLQIVYGNKSFSEEEIQSFSSFIKKNKYDNQQNVVNKLTNVLKETPLKKYNENCVLNSLFNKQ